MIDIIIEMFKNGFVIVRNSECIVFLAYCNAHNITPSGGALVEGGKVFYI